LTTKADLDGLGASEGALLTWTIPASLSGAQLNSFPGRQTYGMPVEPMNLPTAARTGNDGESWLALVVVLCLAILLVSRLKANDKSKDKS
jgi:hypothetical protein